MTITEQDESILALGEAGRRALDHIEELEHLVRLYRRAWLDDKRVANVPVAFGDTLRRVIGEDVGGLSDVQSLDAVERCERCWHHGYAGCQCGGRRTWEVTETD